MIASGASALAGSGVAPYGGGDEASDGMGGGARGGESGGSTVTEAFEVTLVASTRPPLVPILKRGLGAPRGLACSHIERSIEIA